jgi:hypothetical protein
MSSDRMTLADLDVERVGAGSSVVLVQEASWTRDAPGGNSASWRGIGRCVFRIGFAASRPVARGDFELEAPLIGTY